MAQAAASIPPELSSAEARALATEGINGDGDAALSAQQERDAARAKDPALTYEDRIKEFGMSVPQALEIIDSLAVKGDWREDVQVSKTISATFSTRSARFNSYLANQIDIADVKKVGKLNQLMVEMQIAGSLARYGEHTMPELPDNAPEDLWVKALDKRRDFVQLFPSPVFLMLANKLSKFDAKLIVVFSEGYEANF
jgi:hypothetical protein